MAAGLAARYGSGPDEGFRRAVTDAEEARSGFSQSENQENQES